MKTRVILIALFVMTATVLGQRTKLKPGLNSYSPQDDVQLGREVAQDAEKQLNLITNRDANTWVTALGQRLLAKAPNEYQFPFTFKIVDERSINAFALPGGPIYVHRGAIEAADNEAQIAGVVGHEIGHILLRHGTNQASKGQVLGGLAGALGGLLGNSTAGKLVAGAGGFAANSVLLRYSRDAETQSDILATQMLYDIGYDPRGMSDFFAKLEKEHKGSKTEQFFSNHPIPANRVVKVNEEIKKLGPALPSPKSDTPDFQRVKKLLLAMPEPKPKAAANAAPAAGNAPAAPSGSPTPAAAKAPPLPSAKVTILQAAGLQLQHPDNWKPVVDGTHVMVAPAGGVSQQGDMAYGIIADVFKPQNPRNLDQATTEFIQGLAKSNPAMKLVRSKVQTRVDNRPALVTEVSNDSPLGGKESDIIVTFMRSATDLQYLVLVAPTPEMPKYSKAFQTLMDSVRVR